MIKLKTIKLVSLLLSTAVMLVFFQNCNKMKFDTTAAVSESLPGSIEEVLELSAINASPAIVQVGQSTILTWSFKNAARLVLNPGNIDVTGLTSYIVTPVVTTTYVITATNKKGNATSNQMITVTVNPLAVSIASFTSSAASVISGQSVTLNWSAANATSLRLDPGNIDVTGQVSRTVMPLANTTYILTAANANGSVNRMVTVNVTPPLPVITNLAANPAAITSGQTSTISWSVSGTVTSLMLNPGNIDVTGKAFQVVSPTSNVTYTLVATNPSGSVSNNVAVSVSAPLPLPSITSFNSSAASITSGQSATLSWSVSGTYTALRLDPGNINVMGASSMSVSPTSTTIYTLTATNATGSVNRTSTITVNAAPPPPPTIGSFSVVSATIISGQTTILNWSVSGATSVRLNPGNIDVTGQSSRSISPLANTTYTLTASNISGSANSSVNVVVNPAIPSIASFSAVSGTIVSGQSTTLNWSVSGTVTSLRLDPGNIDVLGQSSRAVAPLLNTTYTLTASNGTGSATRSTTITVNPVLPSILAMSASPTTIVSGGSATISWSVSGTVTSLTLNPGNLNVTGQSSRTISGITANTTYTLTATNATGSVNQSVNIVTTPAIPAPVITSFTGPVGAVTPGGPGFNLNWTISGTVTSLKIDPGNIPLSTTATMYTVATAPLTNTTYTLTATNGSGFSTKTVNVIILDLNWIVPNTLSFNAGSTDNFDLRTTLPSGAVRGGTFAVDPSGAPLPAGMILEASGTLRVGIAVASTTNGVVFVYTEP